MALPVALLELLLVLGRGDDVPPDPAADPGLAEL